LYTKVVSLLVDADNAATDSEVLLFPPSRHIAEQNGNKWLDCRMYGKYGVAWNETNRYVWPGVGTENVERILQLHIWLMILV